MQISFFEEFCNGKSLSKLELIKFPTKLYLADYSIEGFKQYKKELSKYNNIKEFIYWPVLNVNEGYWLSPFSKRKALLRLFNKLLNEKISILWDAEPPKNRTLIFTQIFKYFKNKKLIKSFFKKYQGTIYTAESSIDNWLFKFNLLNFDPKVYNNIPVKMMYSSTQIWLTESTMKSKIQACKERYGNNFIIGLGLLAKGMGINERILTKEQLERDLKICKELNVKEVVLFRLEGLNEEYLEVIKKYI